MKRISLICLILLMAVPLFAQSPRDPGTTSEGKTMFTDIEVTGLNATGVPAYIGLADTDGDVYYLFVNTNGVLCIASDIAVGYQASPQTSTWESLGGGSGAIGKPVGAQTNYATP